MHEMQETVEKDVKHKKPNPNSMYVLVFILFLIVKGWALLFSFVTVYL
jgi:hypothetical protein